MVEQGSVRASLSSADTGGDALSLQIDLLEVSSTNIVVTWPPEDSVIDERLEVGRRWTDVTLNHQGELLTLQTMIVSSTSEDKVQLEPADDQTRSALWLFVDQLYRNKIGENAPSRDVKTGVDSIPARGQHSEAARLERLEFMRQESGKPLESLEESSLLSRRLTGNIENLISSVEVPVGVAGPLVFRGEAVQGVAYAPLATTEGTLVASASRGARALTRCGGVTTRVLAQRMLRAPLFVLTNLESATLFARWIRDQHQALSRIICEVSGHAELIEVKPVVLGRHVHVTFLYETGDAAGQNMTTTCTWHACQWVLAQMKFIDEIEFDNFVIDGNMSSDKKVSYQSFASGRGTRVVAESFLDRETLEHVLKVSPEQLLRTHQAFMAGSIQSGMVGFNINVANIIAAIFTATGQDIGCVHESSLGQLYLESSGDGVVASMVLPGLIVGTVGGGTQLPRQRDYLELMGCSGSGYARRLAEIIAGFCLALDLSTLSAIASGQFAQAHEKLGRNRPVKWLQREDLNAEFFQDRLRQGLQNPELEVIACEPIDELKLGSSIITELTARKIRKVVGHFPFRLHLQNLRTVNGHGEKRSASVDVIAKVKPIDEEIILMLNTMAAMCGPEVAESFSRTKSNLDFSGCDEREVAIYEQQEPGFRDHMPQVYGTLRDRSREAFVLILEYLDDAILLDTADDVSGWGEEHIVAALEGIAKAHSVWFERDDELREKSWVGAVQTAASMEKMSPLWRALADHGHREFSEWISEEERQEIHGIIDELPRWYAELEEHPVTLVHNDFNPRNVCLRSTAEGLKLCAYDWELATIAPPQRDVAEFLAFLLPADVESDVVERFVDVHRRALEAATGKSLNRESWHRGFELCLLDLTVHRFGLYLMAHTFRHYGFMERTIATLRRLRAIV